MATVTKLPASNIKRSWIMDRYLTDDEYASVKYLRSEMSKLFRRHQWTPGEACLFCMAEELLDGVHDMIHDYAEKEFDRGNREFE